MGIFEAEDRFGTVLTNCEGRKVPVRFIGEQHVKEDCGGRIPSVSDWLAQMKPAPWMGKGRLLDDDSEGSGDPVLLWRKDVADGRTVLGLREWIDRHDPVAD